MAIDKRWLPPLPKNAERGKETWLYPDRTSVDAHVAYDSDGANQTIVYRASTKRLGRGWLSIDEVPRSLPAHCYSANDHGDACFTSPDYAAEALYELGLGPANVAE